MSGPSNHPAAAYPSWLRPARIPVTVIIGPPGNGARAHVATRAASGDLVIDLAEIIAELSGLPAASASPDWLVPALGKRNAMLDGLAEAPTGAAAWVISPSPLAWQRRFWAEFLGARVELLDPGIEAALAGARAEGVVARWVHRWYAEARADLVSPAPVAAVRPSAAKRGYGKQGKMDHRVLRDKQLAHEPHCRFCKAEGRGLVPATVLDHIEPFRLPDGSFDGKRWGDPANHRSLCASCHNIRGAKWNRPEKPPGAASDGRPLDPAHPWNRNR